MGLDLSCCKDFRFCEGRKRVALKGPQLRLGNVFISGKAVESGSRVGRAEAGPYSFFTEVVG